MIATMHQALKKMCQTLSLNSAMRRRENRLTCPQTDTRLQSGNAHILFSFFLRDFIISVTLPRRRGFRVKSAGTHGQMSAPVFTHLGWPQWQALSTARNAWGRALSASWVKQWPVVSPSHTGSGCNALVPHNRARNLSIEASPAGTAEGGGREGPFQEGNPRSQGPGPGWETCTRGGGTPTRKRGGARVTGRSLTTLAASNPAHGPAGPSLASARNLDAASSCVTSAVESELLWLPEAGGFLYWSPSRVPLFPLLVSPSPEIRNV